MARTTRPSAGNGSGTSIKIVARPNTAVGHAAMAKDHSRAAVHHASRAEALSRDARRETPKSKRG